MVAIRRLVLIATLLVLAGSGHAQRVTDPNANLWISHWGDHRLGDHWGFHTELHWRRANMGLDWQQLLIRPAINYRLSDQVMFTLGYSYYQNYGYGAYPIAFNNWEHQLYQQVQLSGQSFGRVRVQHRFRMEERFIAQLVPDVEDASAGELDRYAYQSRFRYRVWVTVPLGRHTKVEPGVVSANFYDEVFLSFGDSQRVDHINQNRLSALLGYQVTRPFSVLLGYLYQVIERPGAANGQDLLELNSTLHLALVYELDLRRAQTAATPAP